MSITSSQSTVPENVQVRVHAMCWEDGKLCSVSFVLEPSVAKVSFPYLTRVTVAVASFPYLSRLIVARASFPYLAHLTVARASFLYLAHLTLFISLSLGVERGGDVRQQDGSYRERPGGLLFPAGGNGPMDGRSHREDAGPAGRPGFCGGPVQQLQGGFFCNDDDDGPVLHLQGGF